MKISDIVKLRDEVIHGEIHGIINLRGLFENGREADAEYIFNITYPTEEIKDLIRALNQRIKGEREHGFFTILGGYGTGKSHMLLLIYHLLKNPEKGREWLSRNNMILEIPQNPTVLVIHLTYKPPKYLWDPIFKGLNREDLLREVEVFPGSYELKEALKGKGLVVLIIDELESWYKSLSKEVKGANLNFLQVLAEVSSEKDSNLIVFITLYREVPEIMARIDRVKPYRLNLTTSRDRAKIILFRLIENILDREAISKIAESYMESYRMAELEIQDYLRYRERIKEYYPIHPELMDTLLQKYSSDPNYQNTRGVLYLLSSVLKSIYDEVDLVLTSDIDMDNEELLSLGSLGRRLTESAKQDMEYMENLISDPAKRELTRKILNVILLHSFGEEKSKGASRNDVVLGVLRPGININDIDLTLEDIEKKAPHVWIQNGKYILSSEANIMTLVHNEALRKIKQEEIKRALEYIKEKLRINRSYRIYHPDYPDISDNIEDDKVIKVVVSLRVLNEKEILELYENRQYPNRLILYMPKPEAGDLIKNEDILVIAERIQLWNDYLKKASEENRKYLRENRERDERTLEDKLSDAYGYWVKITEFEPKTRRINYRPEECKLESIIETVKKHYDVETIKNEILNYLKNNKNGTYESIQEYFIMNPGKPIIFSDETLKEAIKGLEKDGVIIVSGRTLWLKEYFTETTGIKESLGPKEETIRIEERKVTEAPREEKAEAVEPSVKPIVKLETNESSTLHQLSNELERKVSRLSEIRNARFVFKDVEFDVLQKLLKLLEELQIRDARVESVNFELHLDKSMRKDEFVFLVNQITNKIKIAKLGKGSVKAIIEGQ